MRHSTVRLVCLFLLLTVPITVARRFIPGGRRLIPTSESHRGFTCWAFYAHRQSSGTSTRFSISPQQDVAPVSITGPDVSFQAARCSIPSGLSVDTTIFFQCQQSERTFSQCLMCTSRTTSRYCCGDFITEPRPRPALVFYFSAGLPCFDLFFQDVPQDASTIPGTASVESVSKSAPPEIAGVCTAAHCQKRPISLADYYFPRTILFDLAEDPLR